MQRNVCPDGGTNIGPKELQVIAFRNLLSKVRYKDWLLFSDGSGFLSISLRVTNNLNTVETVDLTHLFSIPTDILLGTKAQMRRFILDSILKVEAHEACELFRYEGEPIFFPDHSPGGDPYAIVESDGP